MSSEDHGHQYGLPAPVDAEAECRRLICGAVVAAVEVRDETRDFVIRFASGTRLELVPRSSGYESWQLAGPGGSLVVAQGGGHLAIWRALNAEPCDAANNGEEWAFPRSALQRSPPRVIGSVRRRRALWVPATEQPETRCCDECGSDSLASSSPMTDLCPECSHWLYGLPPCAHEFVGGRCARCGWDGSVVVTLAADLGMRAYIPKRSTESAPLDGQGSSRASARLQRAKADAERARQAAWIHFERLLSALDRLVAALVELMAPWSRAIGG